MDPDRSSAFYGVKRHLRKGRSEDIFAQFFRISAYNAVAAGLLIILHVVMARLLGPVDYSEYGVFIAIIFTFFVAATSIQLIITRFVSYHQTRYQSEQVNYLVRSALKWTFFFGFFLFVLTIIFSQQISEFFNIQEVMATVIVGFVLWFTVMQPVFEGAFRGLEEFSILGRMRVVEAFLRVLLAIGLVLAGFSVAGAVFGLGLGTFIALMLTYKYIYRMKHLKSVSPNFRSVRRYAVPVIIAMCSFALLMNIDIILVKYFFSSQEAGVFAAASFFAKIPVFISLVFVGVLFPRVTKMHADGKNSVPVLKNALMSISVVMGVFTLLSFFFAQNILGLIFGSEYVIGPILGFYVFGMSCLALSMILIIYLLAVRRDRVAFALPLACVAFIFLLVLFHASFMQVIIVSMLVLSIVLAYSLYAARDILEFDYFL